MSDVYVYIYDLTKGMARAMSMSLLGKQLEGVWHTGIVVFGTEWYFGGGGIGNCPPCGTILGQPEEKKFLGRTHVSPTDFQTYLFNLSQTRFRPNDYHLIRNNCNNFSDEVAQFLTGTKIPAHITGLPQEVLDTPFGRMIMPMLEQMTVDPGTNRTLFGHPPSRHSERSDGNLDSARSVSGASSAGKSLEGKSVEISRPAIELAVERIKGAISPEEGQVVEEIREFCSIPLERTIDWTLGRPHFNLLVSAVSSSSASSAAADLLAAALRREEVVAMATRDPNRQLRRLTASLGEGGNDDVIRVLANLTAHEAQWGWMLSREEIEGNTKTTPFTVLTGLLGRVVEKCLGRDSLCHLSIICFNTSLGVRQLSKDTTSSNFVTTDSLELVPPILEYLVQLQMPQPNAPSVQENDLTTIEAFVETLGVLSRVNDDVKMLVMSYGVDAEIVGSRAPKAARLAGNLFG